MKNQAQQVALREKHKLRSKKLFNQKFDSNNNSDIAKLNKIMRINLRFGKAFGC